MFALYAHDDRILVLKMNLPVSRELDDDGSDMPCINKKGAL